MIEPDRSSLEADLERHRQSGDFASQAEALMALGDIAYEDEEYSLAQVFYAQACSTYEQTANKAGMAKAALSLAEALNNLFWEYTNRTPIPPEYSRREINLFYEQALGLYTELEDKQGQAETYIALGDEAFDDVGKAQTQYRLALTCYEALGDIQGQADTLKTIGERLRSPDPARRLVFESALKLYQELGDERNQALCTMYLGHIDREESDYKMALYHLEYAATVFARLGDTDWRHIIHLNLEELRDKTIPERIYQRQCIRTSEYLHAKEVPHEMITLWEEVANMQDQNTTKARLMMQSLLSYSVKISKPELQSRLYWHWGRMEYYHHSLYQMGLALCQWAVSLMQRDGLRPDLVIPLYQKPLDQMRREISS